MTKIEPNGYNVKNGETITIAVTPNNGAIGAVTCVSGHTQIANTGSDTLPAFHVPVVGPSGKQLFVRVDCMFTTAPPGATPFFAIALSTSDPNGTDDPNADRVFKSSTGPLNDTSFVLTIVS